MSETRLELFSHIREAGFDRIYPNDANPKQYVKTVGNRKLTVQVWWNGLCRVSHGIIDPTIDGSCHETTPPTDFHGYRTADFDEAVNIELTRTDQKLDALSLSSRRQMAYLAMVEQLKPLVGKLNTSEMRDEIVAILEEVQTKFLPELAQQENLS